MNTSVVSTIVGKDVVALRADRFFLLMTALSIVLYPLFYWLLPDDVEETIMLGVSPSAVAEQISSASEPPSGLGFVGYVDEAALRRAVVAGDDDIVAGIAVPADFLDVAAAGERVTVTLLITADVPPEITALLEGLVSELAYTTSGQPPPLGAAAQYEVLGEDRVGNQVPLRDQLRPLLAFFVLMVETFALASLVAGEVQQRTVTAVLVTPATPGDFIAAKGAVGTSLAFTEAAFVMLLIGGFAVGAPILLVALLLGALLVTGFGLLAGASGKDFITVLFISMMFMIPLMIPAFVELFPGSSAGWIKAIPSYGLVETIVAVSTRGAGWADVAGWLLALALWCTLALLLGAAVLRRRVATL